MRHPFAIALVATTLLTTYVPANASNNTAQVVTLRVNNVTNGIRVSIQLQTVTTSCPFNGWYFYEYLSSSPGAGPTWTAILMAAQASNRPVTISGTATCDPHGLETVSFIDAVQ